MPVARRFAAALALWLIAFVAVAADLPRAKPEEVGLSSARLENIRKVLGASVGHIVGMLSKDFLKLVVISLLIASPIAWWAMQQWLQDFAYRTDISWWIFGLAAFLALLIAVLTVSFQAVRAAVSNPVNALRSE